MTISLYSASVPVFNRMFNQLLHVLDLAEKNATERKIKLEVLVAARLAPDMHPLTFQVQSATDRAKFALARITGKTPPSWADDEKTLEQLRARIRTALEHIASYSAGEIDGAEDKAITVKVAGQDTEIKAQDYILNNVFPNFYFHVTTAYAILRNRGVALGKPDYLGKLELI